MNGETVFQIAAIVLLLSGFSVSMYYRRKAAQSGEKISNRGEGGLIYNLRRLVGLGLWLGAFAYLVNPRWMAWSSLPLPAWARWAGAGVMLVCVPLIYWVFSSLGKNVTTTVAIRAQHSLVTEGPYRWVRHPLYTVGFLSFMGLSLLAANWFILLMLLLGTPVIAERTHIEEARLVERFGQQYRDYMRNTGRYLPKLRGG